MDFGPAAGEPHDSEPETPGPEASLSLLLRREQQPPSLPEADLAVSGRLARPD